MQCMREEVCRQGLMRQGLQQLPGRSYFHGAEGRAPRVRVSVLASSSGECINAVDTLGLGVLGDRSSGCVFMIFVFGKSVLGCRKISGQGLQMKKKTQKKTKKKKKKTKTSIMFRRCLGWDILRPDIYALCRTMTSWCLCCLGCFSVSFFLLSLLLFCCV